MHTLQNYFLAKISPENPLMLRKAKSLVTTLFVIFVIIVLMTVGILVNNGISKTLNMVIALAGVVGSLFLVRSGNYNLAANGLALVLLLLLFRSTWIISYSFDLGRLTANYFIYLSFIVFSGLFAHRVVFWVKVIAVFASALLAHYKLGQAFDTPAMQQVLHYGLVMYLATVSIISIISYLFERFLSNAIDELGARNERATRRRHLVLELQEQMQLAITQLAHTSEQIDNTAKELMWRANTQAATTEEVAASVAGLAEQIDKTAKDSDDTYQINERTVKNVTKNGTIIGQTIGLVSQIASEVTAIHQINATTHILSINAAIEAAGAGKAGKGFMVIANEMRTLSEQTRTAAELIAETAKRGNSYSQIAEKALSKMGPELNKTLGLLSNMREAIQSQHQNAQSIQTAMQHLADTTGGHSAAAEELAATSHALLEHANALAQQTRLLKELNDDVVN